MKERSDHPGSVGLRNPHFGNDVSQPSASPISQRARPSAHSTISVYRPLLER